MTKEKEADDLGPDYLYPKKYVDRHLRNVEALVGHTQDFILPWVIDNLTWAQANLQNKATCEEAFMAMDSAHTAMKELRSCLDKVARARRGLRTKTKSNKRTK